MPTLEPLLGNLLTEPLIGCRTIDGYRHRLTLPGILALLADPTQVVESFTALQAHQGHAWHAFTVQLAAMVCQRDGVQIDDPHCRDEAWWRERLRNLGGGDEPWTLMVEDLGKPAFMQPSVPERRLDAFKTVFARPDDFDVAVTTKNHDRKAATQESAAESWLAALLVGQTMQGFSGRSNYGIFRMNGGFGNRPGIGFARPDDLGAWFRSDVIALLASRAAALEHGFTDQGHPLLWALPWNGTDSLTLPTLDPWCIECCRRVRLVRQEGRLVLLQAPTAAARVDAPGELTGNVGDPWTPVARADGKALTLPSAGFSYNRVQGLLFSSDWIVPATQQRPGTATTWVARTLVRGQGKTEGFHERHVPISERARRLLAEPDGKAKMAERAKKYVDAVSEMRTRVLWPALKALAGEYSDPPAAPLATLDAEADANFFPHLWRHLDASPEDALRAWQALLRDRAQDLLNTVIATVAPAASLRWRRIAEADSRFQHGLWTCFKPLMEASRAEVNA